MCGRYSLSKTAELVQEAFEAEYVETSEAAATLVPRWNIAPTQEAPVVRRREGGGRRLDLLRWGLGDGRRDGAAHINARGETAAMLPTFRDGFRARRCLIPADGFYEWQREGGQRQPFHIRFRDRRLFALAGLWEAASFTILTCPPSALVVPLHDRMPVILPPAAWKTWLASGTEPERLRDLLVPWDGDEMERVAVDPWVNKADHEGERCVREIDVRQVPRQLSLL